LKCIVCYGVGAEPADPGGDSSRLRLSKVKRGLGGRRDIASRALVPRSDLCPSKLPLHFLYAPGSKTLPSPIGSFAWQDIQDVSCQIFSDLYIGATLVLVWAGVVFSDRSGVSSEPGLWLRGLGPVCVGLKPGLRVRLCHERFAGSTGSNGGARSSGALSSAAAARSSGPGGKINARTAMFLRTG
jgi:hypothetical protein